MLDETKSLEQIEFELAEAQKEYHKVNNFIQELWDNYVKNNAILLKKQEKIEAQIEDLLIERGVRTKKFKG